MKAPSRPLLWLLAVAVLLIGGNCSQAAWERHYSPVMPTRVYIVRHAEKDLTPGLADPPLTPAGQARALALRKALLKHRPASAIFSTATTRTRATAEPLAQALHLPIQPYDAKQLPALAALIRRRYVGQDVVVIGHSNTILETVEALGAPRPVPTISDEQYDYLLEVTIPRDSTQAATAVAQQYGRRSAVR